MGPLIPVFPTVLPLEPIPSSSSSSSCIAEQNYVERLAHIYSTLSTLSDELCPSSCPPSPHLAAYSASHASKITNAVNLASSDPSNPKWGHVSRLVKLGCTSRGYKSAASGVRVGDTRKVVVQDFDWTFPETEEQWEDCERRWAERRSQRSGEKEKTSKYFSMRVVEDDRRKESQIPEESKADRVREKVHHWQATIVRAEVPVAADKGKGKEISSGARQPHLGFPVVKRSEGAGKAPKGVDGITLKSSVNKNAASLGIVGDTDTVVEQPAAALPGIKELSEMSFLPPSFPSQLPTSTPQLNNRAKPLPIMPQPFPSSPFAMHSPSLCFEPSRPGRSYLTAMASSSQPVATPTPNVKKRTRPVTPPEDDVFTETIPSAPTVPLVKKARTVLELVSSAGPPPSTPSKPPAHSRPSSTPPPSLGNANGLPLPTTPNKNTLPTLSELLASSRQSKPRPRPPSRKLKSADSTPQNQTKYKPSGDELPALKLPVVTEEDDAPRTYLSSPASASSESSGSPRIALLPDSPLFSQNPDAFAPAFVSSQAPRNGLFASVGNNLPNSTDAALLARASSGFFGTGYNSQFDVEGQVGMVSEILDRDVDLDGWLKDASQLESSQKQFAQSQDEIESGP